MTHAFFPRGLLFAASILFPALAFCQASRSDTSFLSNAKRHAREVYVLSIGSQSHLYNGVQYREYNASPDDRGIPYFETDDWVEGSVTYDGEVHDSVAILYDILHDKVVIEHGVGGIKLQLIDEKLTEFTIPGHKFVQLAGDTLKQTGLDNGFYELACDGPVKFYIQWRKQQLEVLEDHAIHYIFLDNHRFYIFRNGTYHSVKTKSDVLKVLADNKSLRRFIRKNNVNFRQDRPKAIAQVVSNYNNSGN